MKIEDNIVAYLELLKSNLYTIKIYSKGSENEKIVSGIIDALPQAKSMPHQIALNSFKGRDFYSISKKISSVLEVMSELMVDKDVIKKTVDKLNFVPNSKDISVDVLKLLLYADTKEFKSYINSIDVMCQEIKNTYGEGVVAQSLNDTIKDSTLFYIKDRYISEAESQKISENVFHEWITNADSFKNNLKIYAVNVAEFLIKEKGVFADKNLSLKNGVLASRMIIDGLEEAVKDDQRVSEVAFNFYKSIPSSFLKTGEFLRSYPSLSFANDRAFIDHVILYFNFKLKYENSKAFQAFVVSLDDVTAGRANNTKDEYVDLRDVLVFAKCLMDGFDKKPLTKDSYNYLLSGIDGLKDKTALYFPNIISYVKEPENHNIIDDMTEDSFYSLMQNIKIFSLNESTNTYTAYGRDKELIDMHSKKLESSICEATFGGVVKLLDKAVASKSDRGKAIVEEVANKFIYEFNYRFNDEDFPLYCKEPAFMDKLLTLVSHPAYSNNKEILFDKINAPLRTMVNVKSSSGISDSFVLLAFTEKRLDETLKEKIGNKKIITHILAKPKLLQVIINEYKDNPKKGESVLNHKELKDLINKALNKNQSEEALRIKAELNHMALESLVEKESSGVALKNTQRALKI